MVIRIHKLKNTRHKGQKKKDKQKTIYKIYT